MSDAEASPRLLDYLAHVVEAIERINHYAQGMDELAFATDQRTQDAVIRNFEVIGEACNNVAKQFPAYAAAHPEVPWRFAYDMRNVLAHGYFKIDLEILWRTIQRDLPTLQRQVRALWTAAQ